MMRFTMRHSVLLATLLPVTACASITYSAATIEQVVAMNRAVPEGSYDVIAEFEEDRRPIFLVADLITARDAELADVLRREIARAGGDAVINLRIVEEEKPLDFLIFLIGQGLVSTRTVTFKGDIVRWRQQGLLDPAVHQFLALHCTELTGSADRGRPLHVCGLDRGGRR